MQSILKSFQSDSYTSTSEGTQTETPLQPYTDQMEKEESKVPQNNLFRDGNVNEHYRDLKYYSGKNVRLDENKKLMPKDFSEDYPCFSKAENHIKAAQLKRDADYTESFEVSAQDADNNFYRTVLLRPETIFGLYYFEHVINNLMKEPSNVGLMRRLCVLAFEWEGRLKSFIGELNEDRHAWLRDLIILMAAICRSCSTVEEQIAAINTSLVEMALNFSSAAGIFPSAALGVQTRSVLSSICKEILENMCQIGVCKDNKRMGLSFYADQPGISPSAYFSSLRDVLQSRNGF
ncbi:p52K [Psittacine adenovirus 2]|uniref:P52K n=1 Tax=Psittacine adenovirus 2 TaxID=1301246 RepID=A0ABX8SN86_9ADEN|nr:p52K [Psittacine adenovirus 2]QZW33245.1 ORF06 52K [Psittacine siadenovirus F]QZW33689.1 ORF06 52K [Psittacine adenovirus 2]WGL41014.1 52K [Psittacine siadenovirus F]WGL41039.1 52K [Psittacine siadenovirus F]